MLAKPRLKWLIAAGLPLVAAVAVWWVWDWRSSRVGGRNAAEWSMDLAQNTPQQAAAISNALFTLGPRAVPALCKQLRRQESGLRQIMIRISPKLPSRFRYALMKRVGWTDAATCRTMAARALGMLDTNAIAAIPNLTAALGDASPMAAMEAATTLGHLGEAALPAVANAAKDPDPQVRRWAVYALTRLSPRVKAAQPALLEAVHDTNAAVRAVAIQGLQFARALAFTNLFELAARDHGPRRETATRALAQIHSPARLVMPLLLDMARDTNAALRLTAIECLPLVQPWSNQVFRTMLTALADPVPEIRAAASNAFSSPPARLYHSSPVLVAALEDDSVEARLWAARALGRLPSPGGTNLVALESRLPREGNPAVSNTLAESIAALRTAFGRSAAAPGSPPPR